MITIKYMSDIHCEFGANAVEICKTRSFSPYFDVLVIAGDINVGNKSYDTLLQIARQIYPRPLIYTTGNHDYYYSSVSVVNNTLRKLDRLVENFHFIHHRAIAINKLSSNVVDIENADENCVIILGATGWQNFDEYNHINFDMMNDFRLIKSHNKNVRRLGNSDFTFIKTTLERFKNFDTIVVTHIPPTQKAINFNIPEVTRKLNYIRAYYNDWEELIEEYAPKAWICGHVHDTYDVKVNNTRIVRNAHGYLNCERLNSIFDKDKIIEVN